MKITFIAHSSFLAETDRSLFLFDYCKNELPPISSDKPLYCFASHSHRDHFSHRLFSKTCDHPDVHYILSDDIARKQVPKKLLERTIFMPSNSTADIDSIRIRTLRSTDLGVAFIIEEGPYLLYHAGDLNDWQWEGESEEYNAKMETDYLTEMKKLSGTHFSAAFLPLDPRQSPSIRGKGIQFFLNYASADYIFPMHMWGHPETAQEYSKILDSETASHFIIPVHPLEKFQIK